MNIQPSQPRQLVFRLQQEPGDKNYGSCLWANVYLNLDDYSMTVHSDAGNYTHTWSVTKDESFMQLLCRMEHEYLLRKLAEPTVFDLNTSKAATLKVIGAENAAEFAKAFDDIDISCLLEAGHDKQTAFYLKSQSLMTEYGISYDFETVQIVMDFDAHAYAVVNLLHDHLQPYLREHYQRYAAYN